MEDETLLRTMKNGLMIAGHEMGPVGDHWPAINAVMQGAEQEFENIRRDEAVLGELEFHIANAIHDLEDAIPTFSPEEQEAARKFVREQWEKYYAIFESVAPACEPSPDDLLSDEQKASFKALNAAAHIISKIGGRA
jgi:DNA-binding protein H-NS